MNYVKRLKDNKIMYKNKDYSWCSAYVCYYACSRQGNKDDLVIEKRGL